MWQNSALWLDRTPQCGATNCYNGSYQTPSLSCGTGCGHARLALVRNIIQRKPNLLWWGGAFSKICPVRHLLHLILSIPSALMLARLRRWSTWTLQHEELWCQGEELFFGAWQNVLCVCISELLTHDVMTSTTNNGLFHLMFVPPKDDQLMKTFFLESRTITPEFSIITDHLLDKAYMAPTPGTSLRSSDSLELLLIIKTF